jgi:hypothetical protein
MKEFVSHGAFGAPVCIVVVILFPKIRSHITIILAATIG